MKKIFLSLFCLYSVVSFSQMTVKRLDTGVTINNSDIITFDKATEEEAYLGLKIYNSSSNDINVKIKVLGMVNSNGTNIQLCINPVCVASVTTGSSYPNIGSVVPANGQNGDFDHFFNTNIGDGVNNVEYTLKVYQVNDVDEEIGNSVTFTYRYNPNLAIGTFNPLQNAGITLKSNLVKNQFEFESTKNVQTTIYDMNGRLVGNYNLTSGSHSVDTSSLNAGVYVVNFVNEDSQTATAKIIKK